MKIRTHSRESARRTHPRLTPERRAPKPPQWKGKPIFWPILAAVIAFYQAVPAEITVLEAGPSVTVEKRGAMTYVWHPEEGLEWFYLTYTVERR